MDTEYRIVYKHYRIHLGDPLNVDCYYRRGQTEWEPAPRGGITECGIYDRDGICITYGKARCSLKDAFCYRVGREISRGRALKSLREKYGN